MGFGNPAQIGFAAPWRGGTDWPTVQGAGAAQIMANIPGAGILNQPVSQPSSDWHPTIIYLLLFIVGEMLVFHFLSNHLGL